MTVAILYRWKIRPGTDAAFRAAWVRGTEVVNAQSAGSAGSRLHRLDDDWYLAYACWPALADRDAVFGHQPPALEKAIADMQACVVESRDEIVMEVTDDLLTAPP